MRHRTTFQILIVERAFTPEYRQALRRLPKPSRVCGRRTPGDLNDLSIGDLLDLQVGEDARALVIKIAQIILRVSPRRAMRERADRMLGFLFWIESELQRIAQLFENIQQTPTADELRAGIRDLNFGAFGLIDWYARRQGYKDQNDAAKVAWVRVYKCMDIDNKHAAYERRLREVISQKTNK